jgi:hypothetical protein
MLGKPALDFERVFVPGFLAYILRGITGPVLRRFPGPVLRRFPIIARCSTFSVIQKIWPATALGPLMVPSSRIRPRTARHGPSRPIFSVSAYHLGYCGFVRRMTAPAHDCSGA